MFWRGVIFLLVVSSLISIVNFRLRIRETQDRLDVLQLQLEAQKQRNLELDALLNSDEQILVEETARGKLGLVYPDERIYVDIS